MLVLGSEPVRILASHFHLQLATDLKQPTKSTTTPATTPATTTPTTTTVTRLFTFSKYWNVWQRVDWNQAVKGLFPIILVSFSQVILRSFNVVLNFLADNF